MSSWGGVIVTPGPKAYEKMEEKPAEESEVMESEVMESEENTETPAVEAEEKMETTTSLKNDST